MKAWVHIVLASVFMLLVGCAEDARSSFVAFVYPDDAIAKDILAKRIECMHCPTYFRIQTNPSGIKAILNYQNMHRIKKPSTDMESVLYLPKAKWWPSNSEIDKMEKFWIEYPDTDSSESPNFRMALISENIVYFMAKGGNWIRDKEQ
jgi:hypothetical protein